MARHLPDLLLFAIGLLALGALVRVLRRSHPARSGLIRTVAVPVALLLLAGALLTPIRYAGVLPPALVAWVRGLALTAGACVTATLPVAWLWDRWRRRTPAFNPERRRLLHTAKVATFAVPVALSGFAVLSRNQSRVIETELAIPALPDDLHGLRIVQLSDIHMGSFLSRGELERAVAMANETRPHLAVITGDLITGPGDPLDDCLAALAKLRADAGVLGCLGNHEIYARTEAYTTREGWRKGLRFLRNQSQVLRFGRAALNCAGVDYQRFGQPYLVHARGLLVPSMPNLLLSHNPDVFPVAMEQGWDATLAGHTHGGQVNFEILSANVNIMRFYTPFTYGRYNEGPSSLFVTRGIGTVGIPARLGAPPEVALIRLVKA